MHDRARTTVNPPALFKPGTKAAKLTLIGPKMSENAANTLRQRHYFSLLPRVDGCAKEGKPDANDWIITSSAQAQVHQQVQNLMQKVRALQGS